jgi:hypothetical protein
MLIRYTSVVLIAVLVALAGYRFGIPGALVALPLGMLISFATEKLISRMQPSQTLDTVRRRRR